MYPTLILLGGTLTYVAVLFISVQNPSFSWFSHCSKIEEIITI